MPYPTQRHHVTVANFHGLATRIIRAHGSVIGLDPDMEMPDSDWVTERCFELGAGWGGKDVVTDIFRSLKQRPLTEAQVDAELAALGNSLAIQIEQERLAANRATYDDLLRYAELILHNDAVASLYRSHFGAIVVDEYQDLTPQQLRVIQRLSGKNVTFAGDLAQGIRSPYRADLIETLLVKATFSWIVDRPNWFPNRTLSSSGRQRAAVVRQICTPSPS